MTPPHSPTVSGGQGNGEREGEKEREGGGGRGGGGGGEGGGLWGGVAWAGTPPRGGGGLAGLGWAVKENFMVQRKTPSKNFSPAFGRGEAGPHSGTPPPRGGGGRLAAKTWLAVSRPPPLGGGDVTRAHPSFSQHDDSVG